MSSCPGAFGLPELCILRLISFLLFLLLSQSVKHGRWGADKVVFHQRAFVFSLVCILFLNDPTLNDPTCWMCMDGWRPISLSLSPPHFSISILTIIIFEHESAVCQQQQQQQHPPNRPLTTHNSLHTRPLKPKIDDRRRAPESSRPTSPSRSLLASCKAHCTPSEKCTHVRLHNVWQRDAGGTGRAARGGRAS